ncbi:MAG: indolepyruvate ferredoxin oxidoreductase family protein, partial [Rhodobacteraceae bacterium]|nr:indolepyruvate ferredoxin oxidoreductase family protein [Paracoccaceae bacterium]
ARYQNARLARRYRDRVASACEADPDFGAAVARGYHKLLAYKDEYEVARLHAETLEAAVAARFEGVREMRFHLAPPIMGKKDAAGRPVKSEFGPWMLGAMKLLARLKVLRGTPLDPFGRTAERRLERDLIARYEADMDLVQREMTQATRDIALELALQPLEIRGFGHVKDAAAAAASVRRTDLLAAFAAGGWPRAHAAE